MWANPDKDIVGWAVNNDEPDENGVSFKFGPDIVSRLLLEHDMDLIVRSKQVVEDGFEFFSKRQLVATFGAPNFRGEYDNSAAVIDVDESLLVSFQARIPTPEWIS